MLFFSLAHEEENVERGAQVRSTLNDRSETLNPEKYSQLYTAQLYVSKQSLQAPAIVWYQQSKANSAQPLPI
jgi:hypothetical protein